jgi:hypothetical protein
LSFQAQGQGFLHLSNTGANAFARRSQCGAAEFNPVAGRGKNAFAPLRRRARALQTLINAERVSARRTWRDARNHKACSFGSRVRGNGRTALRRRREESVNALTKR